MPSNRHLAAIMFTDIVGYTSIMGNNEEKAMNILQKNRKIHKSLIKKFNGKWLKEMGDGILIRFPSASAAVYCAGAIQKRAKEQDVPLRIGIHLGEIVKENDDVFGDGVNIASRIEAVTEPGSIFVSDSVARNVRNKTGIQCNFWGEETLKNVKEPIRIYTVSISNTETPDLFGFSYQLNGSRLKIWAAIILLIILGISYQIYFSSSPVLNPNIEKSLAVLPFTNLSPIEEDNYFSEGIAEDIRSHLSLIPGIRLISRTSVNQYKDSDKNIPTIGKELGSRYILEGSVRKGESRVRTTVRLIDSNNEEHLWSETYNQPISDILEVQSEISKKIATALRTNFVTNLNFNSDVSPEAYNHYLKGRHLWQTGNPNVFPDAIHQFEEAIKLDPDFALTYAGLADLYLNYAHLGRPSHEVFPKSVDAALKALGINENLAEAHTAYADCIYHYKYEWEESEVRFKTALRINPNYSPALWWYSGMLSALGRHEEAIAHIERAIQLDPLNVSLLGWSGKTYFWAGEYEESAKRFNQVRNLLPAEITMPPYFWVEYYQSVKPPDIIPLLVNHINTLGFKTAAKTALALAYIDRGEEEKAAEIANELSAMPDLTQPHFLALIYTALGNYNLAFQTLNEAYQKRDAALIWVNVNPGFQPLKNDPRFDELLSGMNLK